MNLICQIHTRFNSYYIVLFRTLDCNAHSEQCKHSSVAHIAHNNYCEHTVTYELHCTCDTVKTHA